MTDSLSHGGVQRGNPQSAGLPRRADEARQGAVWRRPCAQLGQAALGYPWHRAHGRGGQERGVRVRKMLEAAPEEACSPPEAPWSGWWEPCQDPRKARLWGRGAPGCGLGQRSSHAAPRAPQATAETVYDILSPAAPISRSLQDKRSVRRSRKGQQPADLREGVAKAYDTVREVTSPGLAAHHPTPASPPDPRADLCPPQGLLDTAQTICDVASRGHEQKGLTGAVGGVIRQLPPTVVKPLILATEATSNLLGGMRNQILPDAHKDHTLKWRSDEAQD